MIAFKNERFDNLACRHDPRPLRRIPSVFHNERDTGAKKAKLVWPENDSEPEPGLSAAAVVPRRKIGIQCYGIHNGEHGPPPDCTT